MKTLSMTLALSLTAGAALADAPGYTPFALEAPHHGRGMTGAIWYPNGGGGREFIYADSPVFHGVAVTEEAAMAEGTHPVILLSHGMGGNIRSLAWMATALADRGAIVVSVNHPNTTWGDFNMPAGMDHWTRAQDLSLALDTLSADPFFAGHIDDTRIMAAGFSYGGWTALSLGGMRANLGGYLDNCDVHRETSPHCDIVNERGLAEGLTAPWDASYADARVTHVVAIEPGLVWGVEPGDLEPLVDNVRLIALGEGEERLTPTDFDASGMADLMPDAQIDRIVPAVHFTALPECKPMAEAILRDENDDPVCTDPEGTDREAVHNRIIEAIAGDLGL